MRRVLRYILVMTALMCVSVVSHAQSKFSKEQLDQMLAPVALYPDALLSQLLMASTYPDDVAAAAQWSAKNTKLSGDAAVNAVQDQPWDPSVMSLVGFPSVMDMMGRQPDWVRSVGDAFLDQPEDVMNSVQRLRAQAKAAGTLTSNAQQKVSTQTEGGNTIVTVEPASPSTVYVPSYDPSTAYGTWPYPSYPPAYYPPPPGSVFGTALVSGLAFGAGVAITNSLWGGFDWGHNDVDIDVNRYNNINVNRKLDASQRNVNWNHDASRRGNTPYRSTASQQRFDQQRRAGATQGRVGATQGAQRPAAGGQQDRRDHAQQVMKDRGGSAGGRNAGAGQQRQQAGNAGAQRAEGNRPAASNREAGARNNAAPQRDDARNAAMDRSRNANRDNAMRGVNNPSTARTSAAHSGGNRAASRPEAHRPSGGGGGRAGGGGGGGGHRGGGRR